MGGKLSKQIKEFSANMDCAGGRFLKWDGAEEFILDSVESRGVGY